MRSEAEVRRVRDHLRGLAELGDAKHEGFASFWLTWVLGEEEGVDGE